MAEGNRSRQEFNVSFAALSGSSLGVPGPLPYGGNTSRMDWSSSLTGMEGRAGRNTNSRSRSQASVRADSFRRSEGRRMSQDTRRYMQAAAASTQTTVQQLLTRLQSYQTFQPLLSHQVPYTPAPEENRSRMTSLGNAAGRPRPPTDRAFTSPQLWQMMNGLLDTSVSHLLQHNAEGHFIVTLQSTLGRELATSAPKVRTVIESRSSSVAAGKGQAGSSPPSAGPAAGSAFSTRPTTAVGTSPHATTTNAPASGGPSSLLADRWAADHPNATAAEVASQRDAWTAFEEKRRKENRTFYLKAMQEQLDALMAEETGQTPSAQTSQSGDSRSRTTTSRLTSLRDAWDSTTTGRPQDSARNAAASLEAVRAAQSEEELKKEADRQRALWLSFQDKSPSAASLVPTSAGGGGLAVVAAGSHEVGSGAGSALQLTPDAPRIVTDYLESTDLHGWLHTSWPHRTHRHESAALRIQCAYRAYRARCEVGVMRYARRQSFMVGLAAEKEARRVWDIALQVQADASKTGNNSSGTNGDGTAMRALQFFIDKINAVVAKRRARKCAQQEQEAEIREYAALCVQRVYRGHRARVYVEELRHPEIVQARQRAVEERAAVLIQTAWRRYHEQRQWRRVRQAACTLQRAVRCRAARRLLAERRRLCAFTEEVELRQFAVHKIEVWYGRHLARRSAFAEAHRTEMRTLQRVCRGYWERLRLGKQRRDAALRVAAEVLQRRRRALLEARAAVGVRAALEAERVAVRHRALCTDAAITIQRAWRIHLALSLSQAAESDATEL